MMNWFKKLMLLMLVKLLTKTDYNVKTKYMKDKIPDITNLATTAALSATINEVTGEILSITNLATNDVLTAVGNKTPDVSTLVKNEYYEAKIKEVGGKYFITSDYDKFMNNTLKKS